MIVSNGISGCGPLEPATFCAQPVPAQQTAIRRPSAPLAARPTASSTCDSSRTSQATKSAARSSPTAWPFSAFTAAIVTVAQRAASARTVASASPEAPPTTIAAAHSISIDGADYLKPSRTRAGEREGEQILGVGEPVREGEPRCGEVALQALGGELGADLGAQL